MLIGKYSSSAHELLLHLLVGHHGHSPWCCLSGSCQLLHMRLEPCAAQPTRHPEGPGKGSAPQRQLETLGRGMQVRSTARRVTSRVRDEFCALSRILRDHAQQLCLGSSLPAPHARADRAGDRVVDLVHHAGTQIHEGWERAAVGKSIAPEPILRTVGLCAASPASADLSPAPVRAGPREAPRRSGCRSANRSAVRPGGRSGPPCRSRATAGSPARRPGRRAPRRPRPPRC